MKKSLGLLSSTVTTRQQIIVGAWYVVLLAVIIMWLIPSVRELTAAFSFGQVLHAFGLLFGLFAAYFALTQFVLMGRLIWVERTFGADHLAGYHRINGYLALLFIVLHPILIVASYAVINHSSYVSEYANTLAHYAFTPLALLGEVLFVVVVVSSIYVARKHLKYETWYGVHLLVYVAIVVSFLHQTVVGSTFVGHPINQAFWYSIYGFVALNILYFRILLPLIDQFSRNFVITKVEQTSPTVTSLYITGANMRSWKVQAGQFVYLRILQRGYWLQEHPFSLSQLPDESGTIRVSIRSSGDFTNTISKVKAGARVAVSRPFGRFTHQTATQAKRLYLAGGIGITPLLTLATESVRDGVPAALYYANTVATDTPLHDEIDRLAAKGLEVHDFFSQDPVPSGDEKGYVTAARIAELTPDYAQRDIYICGPPVMMYGLVEQFLALGVNESLLHYERFALHDQKKAVPRPATPQPLSVKTVS